MNAEQKASLIEIEIVELVKNRVSDKCPDQHVCDILISDGIINVPAKNKWKRKSIDYSIPFKTDTDLKRIILILESPHIKEFEGEHGPAKGKTGDNIAGKLAEKLNGVSDLKGKYQLILMNAIQHQCSLGFPTKYFRDVVFLNLWRKGGGKTEFINRMNKLNIESNDIVINACTKGGHKDFKKHFGLQFKEHINKSEIGAYKVKEGLKNEVGIELNNLKINYIKVAHPSSWK